MIERPITPPRPVNVSELIPELARYARHTTRLHPRRGTPTVEQSSIGAPMLWPNNEPWPTCTTPWWFWDLDVPGSQPEGEHPHRVANPMVPVLQLFAVDAPSIQYPPGTNLLQILWCPVYHVHLPGQDDAYAPATVVKWRDAAELPATTWTPPTPIDAEEQSIPGPCNLYPEQVVEYPTDLPDHLWNQIAELDDDGWRNSRSWGQDGAELSYQYDLSVAPGTKVGGWPRWHAFDPYPMPCAECGQQLDLLVSFGSVEHGDGNGQWDSPDLVAIDTDYGSTTGLTLGRGGDLQIFYCSANPRHPIHTHVQG